VSMENHERFEGKVALVTVSFRHRENDGGWLRQRRQSSHRRTSTPKVEETAKMIRDAAVKPSLSGRCAHG